MLDYILNGAAHGDVAASLLACNGDPGALRPFIGEDGRAYVSLNSGKRDANGNVIYNTVQTNAPASLRFQDWRLIDEMIVRIAKPYLVAVGDLRSRNLDVTLPNGLGHTVYSYENASDISAAQINMSGITKTDTDRPLFDIVNLPLPIIHKDFSFDVRQVMASRNGNTPLDIFTGSLAARRVAELAETLLLGVTSQYQFAGGVAYGYCNFPYRMTKTLTKPGSLGWVPYTLVQEIIAMRQQSVDAFHYGPWILYTSPNLDTYLEADFSAAKGEGTLRDRILRIKGIEDVISVPYLQFISGNPFTAILVQMDAETVREVIALDMTTLQWPTHGGMQMNYKVMCSMTPQLRNDQNLQTGIVHGSVAST